MPARVPYWKQAALTAMVAATSAAAVEAASYSWWYFSVSGCDSNGGPAAASTMDVQTRRQVCEDRARVEYLPYSYPDVPRLPAPGLSTETHNIDSFGFRGGGFSEAKPDGTYRIFVLGGSAVFGSGVPDGMTIPAYLQEALDGSFPYRVEVINAGVPAGTSFGEQWQALNRLPRFEPDLLVVYAGYNDARARHDNPGITHYAHQIALGEAEPGEPAPPDPVRLAWQETKTYQLVKFAKREISMRMGDYETIPFDLTPIPEKARAWQERMESICGAHRAAVFLQPLAEDANITDLHARYHADRRDNERASEVMDAYAQSLESLGGACAAAKDLRRALDDAPVPVMSDAAHLTWPGNEIMAREIQREISGIMPAGLA